MSKSPEEIAFRRRIFDQIRQSQSRITKFVDAEFDFALIREAVLLLDRVHVLNPLEYGHAMASHQLSRLKNQKGICGEDNCYRVLSMTPQDRAAHPQIEDLLSSHCVECATSISNSVYEDYERERELS